MEYNVFGNTELAISRIGLGCWQLGGDWGSVDDQTALRILHTAVDNGINFLDTADVYGGGRSERLIGRFLAERRDANLFVATKVGRYNYPGPYTAPLLRHHIIDSRERLGIDTLDLVQLHCIPTDVMADGAIFDWLRGLQSENIIRHFGASVETMAEAEMILDQPGLTSLQIIFNIFRQKPLESLLAKAQAAGVGIVVRLPLASGLLAGKFTAETTFPEDDHRHYNRDGAAFNVGETFAGLPFAKGVALADELRGWVPAGMTMAQFAQRWLLDQPAVSTVITGASRPAQVDDNAATADLPPLPAELHAQLRTFYQDHVHDHIRGPY